MSGLPRIIHTLWLQGQEEAPEIVHICWARWRKLNPNHRLKIYDLAYVEALLGSSFPIRTFSSQALSDIFRIRLLLEQGGIWVDATVYPVVPLMNWLPEKTFFAFSRPAPDRPISSWFLAATPGHPITQGWWEEIARFWSTPRQLASYYTGQVPPDPLESVSPTGNQPGTYPYFWLHYLFHYRLETHPLFQQEWARSGQLPSAPAHALQALFRTQPNPSHRKVVRALNQAPVQKLDWRLTYKITQGDIIPQPTLMALVATWITRWRGGGRNSAGGTGG